MVRILDQHWFNTHRWKNIQTSQASISSISIKIKMVEPVLFQQWTMANQQAISIQHHSRQWNRSQTWLVNLKSRPVTQSKSHKSNEAGFLLVTRQSLTVWVALPMISRNQTSRKMTFRPVWTWILEYKTSTPKMFQITFSDISGKMSQSAIIILSVTGLESIN